MEEVVKEKKHRIEYLDTTKGILMLCLLYGHMRIMSTEQGINDVVLRGMNATVGLYVVFFMQTFFIITGYCSSFNVPFFRFVWKNVKTLILPALVLTVLGFCVESFQSDLSWGDSFIGNLQSLKVWLYDGGPWFILALFWSKLLFWAMLRFDIKWQIILISILYLSAIWLNLTQPFPNYQWHRHAFLLLPYLAIGYYLKAHTEFITNNLGKLAIFGSAFILLENVLWHTPYFALPWQDENINIDFQTFPMHIITALSGSALIVYIAKKLTKIKVLTTLGGAVY